jgi:hypothetical protein
VGTADAEERQRGLEEVALDQSSGGQVAALEELAAWRSAEGKGGMAWCGALPGPVTDRHMAFEGPAFRETVRHHLRMERAPPGGRCSHCTAEQSGAHIRRCSAGLNTGRHHPIVDALAELLEREARLKQVRKEYTGCFRLVDPAPAHPLQMDLWFSAGQLSTPVPSVQPSVAAVAAGKCKPLRGGVGVSACLDFTLRDGTCASHRAVAFRDVEQGLVKMSLIKVRKYVESGAIDPELATLISLAFDQFGTASRDTHAFFRAVAIRQAQLSAGLYTVAQCVARWRQKLSTLVQRTISNQVVAEWESTATIAGQPHPDICAFRRIHLLCPPGARTRAPLAQPAAPGASAPAPFTAHS